MDSMIANALLLLAGIGIGYLGRKLEKLLQKKQRRAPTLGRLRAVSFVQINTTYNGVTFHDSRKFTYPIGAVSCSEAQGYFYFVIGSMLTPQIFMVTPAISGTDTNQRLVREVSFPILSDQRDFAKQIIDGKV